MAPCNVIMVCSFPGCALSDLEASGVRLCRWLPATAQPIQELCGFGPGPPGHRQAGEDASSVFTVGGGYTTLEIEVTLEVKED